MRCKPAVSPCLVCVVFVSGLLCSHVLLQDSAKHTQVRPNYELGDTVLKNIELTTIITISDFTYDVSTWRRIYLGNIFCDGHPNGTKARNLTIPDPLNTFLGVSTKMFMTLIGAALPPSKIFETKTVVLNKTQLLSF